MNDEKTQKAWAFITASVRLCTDAHRMLDQTAPKTEILILEAAISELLKAKSLIGRRLHG